MYNVNDNDDDLFHDSSFDTESKPADVDIDSFIDRTKENSDSTYLNSKNFMFRASLSTTLYEACARFIFQTDSLNRTIFDHLNAQTNGTFARELYANVLEESLIKRFTIKSFLETILDETNSENIRVIANDLKVDINPQFINIYFGSLIKIMNHAINRSIDIYEKLCVQINRSPVQQIVDRDYSYFDYTALSSSMHIAQSFDSIKKSLGFNTYLS